MSVNVKQEGNLIKLASLTKAITPLGLGDCYTTEERQVGCWTDGKPLYQKTKVIPFSNFTSIQGGARYVCQYKEADEEVKNLEGYAYSASYGYCFLGSRNYEADNTYTNYYWEFNNYYNNLNLTFVGNSASVINVSNVYITYQYTKTTDVAGSGIWTPSGSYAHHYTTAEQIIGTWTDGSTLYEKTQEGGITFSAVNTWYDTNITGVNKVISVNGSITRDGEPIPLGYFTNAINSTWVLKNNTIKLMMPAKQSGETYALNSITVRYTKTS